MIKVLDRPYRVYPVKLQKKKSLSLAVSFARGEVSNERKTILELMQSLLQSQSMNMGHTVIIEFAILSHKNYQIFEDRNWLESMKLEDSSTIGKCG